jgi:ABC-2 type transport system permease protein
MSWEVLIMQSKISFFNKTIYKKNLTRFWPFALLYWLYLTVLHPLAIYMNITASGNRYASPQNIVASHFLDLDVISVFFIALVMGIAVFSYLYQSRSTNMIHAFPLTRRELFFSNYLAGLTLLFIPQLLTALVTNLVVLGQANDMIWMIWAYFGITAAETLFFYGFACLMCMFTGQTLAAGLFYMIWNFLYEVVLFMTEGLVDLFEYGLSSGSFLDSYIRPLFPLGWFMSRLSFYYDTAQGSYCIVFPEALFYAIIGGIVFVALAYFIYQKRQLERAGDFLSMNWTKPVFRWGTAIVGGIAGALCLAYMSGEAVSANRMVAKFVVFLILCALVLFFVAEMFVEKNFRVFKRRIAVEAVSCIAVLLVGSALLQFDIFGIESYVPQPEEIQEAYVECSGQYTFMEPDELENVTAVHQYIVDQIPELKKEIGDSLDNYQYVSIRYTLKSGKWVCRNYNIWSADKEFIDGLKEKLTALNHSAEAVKRSYFGTDYEALDWQVLSAELECYGADKDTTYTVYGTKEQMQALYTALLADIDAGAAWASTDSADEMTVTSDEVVETTSDEAVETDSPAVSACLRLDLDTDMLSNEVASMLGDSYYTSITSADSKKGTVVEVYMYIDEHYTHTLEALVESGTIESVEELGL